MQALAGLQDQLDSFPTAIAQTLIERELGCPVGSVFSELSAEPVAAASLGQVCLVLSYASTAWCR